MFTKKEVLTFRNLSKLREVIGFKERSGYVMTGKVIETLDGHFQCLMVKSYAKGVE